MKKIGIIAIAAAVALAGCNREMTAPTPDTGLFRASIETPTRVAFSDEGVFSWQAGDAVAVSTNAGFRTFTLQKGAGEAKAVFDGDLSGVNAATVAVYPASIAKDDKTVTLPATYAWAEGQSNAAMYCEAVDLAKVNGFKHLGGIIKVSYAEIPADADALVLTAEAKITGDFAIEGGQIAAGAGTDEVKVTFAAGSKPAAFYIPVPTGEFKFSVQLQKAGVAIDGTKKSTTKAVKVARRSLVLMDPVTEGDGITVTISTVKEFQQFLAEAHTYRKQDRAVLTQDIGCLGYEIIPAERFAGTLDGAGHRLVRMTIPNALFANLSGTVKNLSIIDGSITYTGTFPDMTGIAFIASQSSGDILDCTVHGEIKVDSPGTDAEGTKACLYCAGIVGESTTGVVQGCNFSGSIDVELKEKSRSVSAIAGIVACAGADGQTGKVIVKDCINRGSIKFLFSGPSKAMEKFGIGGVVGRTPSNDKVSTTGRNFDCGVIENVTNHGNIEWTYPAGGSGSYPCLGGVAGAVEGELHHAENHGTLKYTGSLTTAVTDASIGGVAGYVTSHASDCHNYGFIQLNAGFAGGTSLAQNGGNTSWSTFGGVFGNVGPFLADKTNNSATDVLVENISNNEVITLTPRMVNTGGPTLCLGGVIGASTANLKNIVNNREINLQTQTKTTYAGGVVGYLAADLEGGINNETVRYNGLVNEVPAATNHEQVYLGGIVGYIVKKGKLVRCANHGSVFLLDVFTTPNALSYVGGINGSYSGGFEMTGCTNDAQVSSHTATPICLGGLSGSFNGMMTDCANDGLVWYDNKYISDQAGKEPEIGGLAGYINGDIAGCVNRGEVRAFNAGFAGGIAGGCGQDAAGLNWTGTDVDCNVRAVQTTRGAVLGRFREAGTTVLTLGATDAPVRVTDLLDDAPLCAVPNGNTVTEANVIRGKIEPAPAANGL